MLVGDAVGVLDGDEDASGLTIHAYHPPVQMHSTLVPLHGAATEPPEYGFAMTTVLFPAYSKFHAES